MLNIFKKLTHTRWGADAKVLRVAYHGYVRGLLEYGLPILAHTNKTALEALDRVKNQGLRPITGAYSTASTAACEIIANVEPLRLRIQKAVVTTAEKFHRYERSDLTHATLMAECV